MESIARPLRRLQEEIAWFARASELRLLHVVTDAALRGTALDLLMGHEHHADNRGLFFRFDDPMTGADRGWPARIQRLRDQVAEKTAAIKPAGIELRPLGDVGGAGRGTSAEFAATLLKVAGILAPPLTNVVVVMAPVRVEEPALFAQDMASLIGSPQLGHVRWIVVEVDGAALTPIAGQLGDSALSCSCVIDESEAQDDLAALGAMNVAELAEPALTAPRTTTWRAPGAMPDVEPPPRIGQPRAPNDEELVAAGLSPKFVNGGGQVLKRLLLGAALAMRREKPTDAITLQTRAASLCAEMEMPREQIINLHVLGGYLIAASQRARAREVYEGSVEIARTRDFPDLGSQSELALGMLEVADRHAAEAATHYAAAGRLAETAKIEPLAIECWRMAGQLALDAKLETSAVECWKRALSLAGPLDPAVAKTTSAPEVARALAAVCRKRGLVAQAQSLDQRSTELEQGAAAVTAPVVPVAS